MAKFERLQWIPMIVKAYNEARQKAESDSTAQAGLPPEHRQAAQPHRAANSVPATGTNRVVARGGTSFHKPSRQTRPAKTVLRNHGKPAQPVVNQAGYQRMIHELRETRRKLRKLESIHSRMVSMQVQIEQQLSTLMERVSSRREAAVADNDLADRPAEDTSGEPPTPVE